VSRRRTLRDRLAWWFATALFALYGTGAIAAWVYVSRSTRQYAVLVLKTEAEALVRYVAETGRLDAPELQIVEEQPIPIWVRVISNGVVVAATPGVPDVPVTREADLVTVSFVEAGVPCAVVRHRVGPRRPGMWVEAIGSLAPLLAREHQIGVAVVLAGLLVIPLAALGGRALAKRALRPVADLVSSIRGLDVTSLSERLPLHQGNVVEMDVLTRAFNDRLARLESSVEAMRRFTADASHEIRNPLSVLRSGIEVTLRRERTAAEYRSILEQNLQEIEHLHAVLEGVLLLARESPEVHAPLSREPVDLSALVLRTLRTFEPLAAERGVRFETEIDPEILVAGDESLLRLVPFNLVDNALKHGPVGQPVHVTLDGDDSSARLVVADRGPGIPTEDRPRIFERFYRAGRAGSVGGLGLSVVRWVSERHEGGVRLLDTESGTSFEVELPLATVGRPG
jgi:signal transduction histidine kinase